jgi:hypothetical protein
MIRELANNARFRIIFPFWSRTNGILIQDINFIVRQKCFMLYYQDDMVSKLRPFEVVAAIPYT